MNLTNQIAQHCDGSPVEVEPNTPRWGIRKSFLYTVRDQSPPDGKTVTYDRLAASEAFEWKSGYNILPTPSTNEPVVSGQFEDEQMVLNRGGPVPSNCQQDYLQTFTVTSGDNNQNWSVRKNCIKWSGASLTVTDVTANSSSRT